MRVLVTGHEGYLGAVMVPFLRAAGHQVVGMDTGFFRRERFGPPLEGREEGRPAFPPEAPRDIRDAGLHELAGFDAVIHLAALSNDPLGDLDPRLTGDINRDGTLRLARLARDAGVPRFLFASSCSLYGVAGDAPVDETAPFNPITPYGRSKVEVEEALRAMATDDFSPTSLRNATAYGVSPALRLDVVVNNLVAVGLVTGEILLKSDGTPWRPLVHAEDIARAFRAVLEAPRERVHARAFNVGRPGEDFRISTLAEMVSDALPGTRIRYAEDAGPDPRSYRVDAGLLPSVVPGYEPRWTVADGIRELRDAFERHGLSREDIDGGRYVRLREIRRLVGEGWLSRDLRWQQSEAPSLA